MADAMTDVVRSAPPEFLFCVLGPLHVRRAGLPVSLGGRQQRAVLARLLMEPKRAVSVEQLADALWGERTPAGAVTTIQTYVSHLRDVLEPSRPRGSPPRVLVTEQRGYRLDVATGSIDSEQFELAVASGRAMLEKGRHEAASVQLRDALALWRGEVLEDLAEYDFVRELAARPRHAATRGYRGPDRGRSRARSPPAAHRRAGRAGGGAPAARAAARPADAGPVPMWPAGGGPGRLRDRPRHPGGGAGHRPEPGAAVPVPHDPAAGPGSSTGTRQPSRTCRRRRRRRAAGLPPQGRHAVDRDAPSSWRWPQPRLLSSWPRLAAW